MACETIAYEGDWITIKNTATGQLVASFRATRKICKNELNNKIVLMYNQQLKDCDISVKRSK